MIKLFTKRRNKKGFTLIELIVVIAILGILAAVAIPRFTGMRQNANQSSIISNLRNIQAAVEIVAAQTNVAVTTINDSGTGAVATALGVWPVGPGGSAGVTYSVVSGVATATLGATPPPLPASPVLTFTNIPN